MHLRICAALLLAFAAAGCANHVRFANEVRDHESREVDERRDADRRAAVARAALTLELALTSEETLSVRRRETLVKLDEETPWRASEELWEVPAGLVAIPFFLAMRASDKLCLGLIPDDTFNHGLDWGFAALNPALNVESETSGSRAARSRARRRELGLFEEHDSRAAGRRVRSPPRSPATPRSCSPATRAATRASSSCAWCPTTCAPRRAGSASRSRATAFARGATLEVPIARPIAERLAAARARAPAPALRQHQRGGRRARARRARHARLPGERARARARAARPPAAQRGLAFAARSRAPARLDATRFPRQPGRDSW